jgi:N-formylglutamate amidohydrolase
LGSLAAVQPSSFSLIGPLLPARPVILAVPHAGRDYPAELLAQAAVHRSVLETLEDRHADSLIARAVAEGASAVVARRARAWIDLNRHELEIDAAMIEGAPPKDLLHTQRVKGGLGLFPRRLAGRGELLRGRLTLKTIGARVDEHRAYHALTAQLIEVAAKRFGIALLIDCHSMPPLRAVKGANAQIVVGDMRGTSADRRFVDRIESVVVRHGLRLAINEPYAGGHTLQRHGKPLANRHAIQIEVDRSLYLDSQLREVGSGLGRLQHLIADIVSAVSDEALIPLPIAAE